jgi:hypothetical protein
MDIAVQILVRRAGNGRRYRKGERQDKDHANNKEDV